MADPRDKLVDALAHVRVMRYPLEFVSSPKARGQLRRGLDAIERDLRDVLAQWDIVDRRSFSKAVAAAAIVPLEAVERLAAPVPSRVDHALLHAASIAITAFARRVFATRPGDLLPLVASHVDRLEALEDASMLPGLRDRLGSLISDAAAMAGWLARDAGRPGQAAAWFASARVHAESVGDSRLHALAVGSEGLTHSTVHTGGLTGDTAHTLWMLDQADGDVGDDPQSRAWLAAHMAAESAAAGDPYAYGQALQRATVELDRAPRIHEGFWSSAGWFSVRSEGWLDGHASRGRMLLGRPDVQADLLRDLDAAPVDRLRVQCLNDLAQYHAIIGEP